MSGAQKIQKTVRLPASLFREVEHAIRAFGRNESVNEFIVRSMKLRLDLLRRKQIDAKFREMSTDAVYQKQARLIAEEFEASDWEAMKSLER